MTVRFHGSMLEYTNGESSFEPGPCLDVQGLVDAIVSRYGEPFAELVRSGACFFLVNGKGLMSTGGLDTPLEMDDRVEVLPFVDAG